MDPLREEAHSYVLKVIIIIHACSLSVVPLPLANLMGNYVTLGLNVFIL